jgi:hypothetical protein
MARAVRSSAKGVAVRGTIAFLETRFGGDVVSQLFDALPAETRRSVRAVAPTDEVPYSQLVALWTAADALVAATAPESGAFSIDSGGMQLLEASFARPCRRHS